MRWFVVFLLVANIALFFWVQQDSRPANEPEPLAAPDVGHLRLLRNDLVADVSETQDAAPVEDPLDPNGGASVREAPVAVVTEGRADSIPPSVAVNELEASPVAPTTVPAGGSVAAVTETATAEPAVPQAPQGRVAEQPVESVAVESVAAIEPPQAAVEAASAVVATETPPSRSPDMPVAVETETAGGSDVEPANRSPMVCWKLGPLDDDQARDLISNLTEHERLLDDASETYRKPDGYYVMIPPLPSRADGRAMLQRLNEADITDTWLFRSGEHENAISLGLFSRQSGAERHAATIEDKGFTPEVRERMRDFSGRFLVIGTTAGDGVSIGDSLPGAVAAVTVDCPRP